MPEETSGVGGPSTSTSFAKSGDRQRFAVDLRPGETTIVSWKKLIKEANKANGSASAPDPLSSPALDIPSQGQSTEVELTDEPPANRFNAVIEKIERLYKGNDSSDEDLDDVRDDDQYDTEDSFIDDAELDEYFQVDNCSTKHNGFFVNKGKLEAMKELPMLPVQQLKKKRKKDISKAPNDDGVLRRKRVKVDKVTIDVIAPTSGNIMRVTSENYAASTNQLHKKDGSNVKTKATMLEKAIKELEKMVAESRPPTMEFQDADMSGQAVKRRLPREIKQKLAKVARLAQANDGEVSEEVVNRLMGFLGHTMQLRTLKRNLRMMIRSGLSAKQEKEIRFQQTKREVVELISKEFESQTRSPDNFQDICSERKGASIMNYTTNIVLEDKICDLYDLYVDGLEEDSGSQIRKLYAELAQLWPNGSMDNHGVKRAICRSKDRKRALHQQEKDSERIRKKKLLTPKLVDKGKLGMTLSSGQQQPQPFLDRQITDLGNQGSNFSNSSVLVSTLGLEASGANTSNVGRLKKEKVKASPNCNFIDDTTDRSLKSPNCH
uniref:Hpc2-related domain-containing protein n=1 Tax=Kalanchoe fedtschenkoi TaxID=63787 RepID=A0A7N0TM32_KALFE